MKNETIKNLGSFLVLFFVLLISMLQAKKMVTRMMVMVMVIMGTRLMVMVMITISDND